MMHLCASCSRHVKQSPCPFCGESGRVETRGLPNHASSLSRAQLVAGAALLGAVTACSSNPATSAVPVYGAPAPDQTPHMELGDGGPHEPDVAPRSSAAQSPALAPHTAVHPMYGMPPN